jgi:hypothetical protein
MTECEELAIAEAERARIISEIVREVLECSDRLIEIYHLLKVPEFGFKNELRRERDELLERIGELNWKLRRL